MNFCVCHSLAHQQARCHFDTANVTKIKVYLTLTSIVNVIRLFFSFTNGGTFAPNEPFQGWSRKPNG